MKQFRTLLWMGFASTALVSLPAHATQEGFYGSLGGGFSLLHDSDIDGVGTSFDTEFDEGAALLGAIGYKYGNGIRTELEFGYRNNNIEQINSINAASDDVHAWTVMLNGLYDFHTGSDWTPYLGAGAGVAFVNFDNAGPFGPATINDDDAALAAQAIAGVDYQFDDEWSLFAQYNYLHSFGLEVEGDNGVSYDADYENSTFILGLRFSFGAPEPVVEAPARASTPAPVQRVVAEPEYEMKSRSHLVFFDWDRADIRSDAGDVITQAAKSALRGKAVRLEVTGHADRSGSDAYNMGLSKRRAQAVKRQLTQLGIDASDIVIYAKGERDPLVQTKDGVREPQNRRVEIVYAVPVEK